MLSSVKLFTLSTAREVGGGGVGGDGGCQMLHSTLMLFTLFQTSDSRQNKLQLRPASLLAW